MGISFFGALLLFFNTASFASIHPCEYFLQADSDDDGYGSVVVIKNDDSGKRRGADEREIIDDEDQVPQEIGEVPALQEVEITPTTEEPNPFIPTSMPTTHRRKPAKSDLPN